MVDVNDGSRKWYVGAGWDDWAGARAIATFDKKPTTKQVEETHAKCVRLLQELREC